MTSNKLEISEETEEGKAIIFVRTIHGKVSLGLSFEHDGDFDVSLTQDEVKELIVMLKQTQQNIS